MSTLSSASVKNSTTVRAKQLPLTLLRLALRSGSIVAPHVTDRVTSSLFFRVPRHDDPRAPKVAGLDAHPFTVESANGRLAAWSWGAGPTVLFAHGWDGHIGQFSALIAAVVAAGYRAVAFDMPAHGRSEGTHMSVVDMARAIRHVAEAAMPFVGLDPAPLHAIVAHSLGGAAAALAVHEGLAVERVVLLAPVAEPTPFAERAADAMQLSPARTAGMMRSIARRLGRGFAEVDVRAFARHLRQPALVFHDPADRDVPIAHGRGIAEAWPGAEFVELAKLGHRRLLKDPDVVRRTIAFLTDPGRSPRALG